MRIVSQAAVPGNQASPANFNVEGDVIKYVQGPRTIRVTFTDNRQERHNIPMARGDQFTLPPGAKYNSIDVFNLSPNAGRVELLVGFGNLVSGGDFLADSLDSFKYGSASFIIQGVAATYDMFVLENGASSGVSTEVLKVLWHSTTGQGCGIIGGNDSPGIDLTWPGYTDVPLSLTNDYFDAALGSSPLVSNRQLSLTSPPIANATSQYLYCLGNSEPIQYQLDVSENPFLVAPGEFIAFYAVDPVTGLPAANVNTSVTVIFRDRVA